jgi:hypothetical protein
MDALVDSLHTGVNNDPVVRSAMVHLNLEFSSIEEWLGANTEDYYSVLARTGRGSWPPRRAPLRDPYPWMRATLRQDGLTPG